MNLVRIILLISILSFGLSNLIKAQLVWQNPLPQCHTLNEVYVFDEINAIAVGAVGTIIKTIDGGTIRNSQTGVGSDRLNSVYSTDSNNGLVAGDNRAILHITNGGVSFVEEEKIYEMPTEFIFSQNFTNPNKPSTTFKYSVAQSSQIIIKLLDMLGNEIEILVNKEKPVGTYEPTWNAANIPSGIYFYQISSASFAETKKMILL